MATPKTFKEGVPNVLQYRPPFFIRQLTLKMKESASFVQGMVQDKGRGVFEVASSTGENRVYTVTLFTDTPRCTCYDWKKTGVYISITEEKYIATMCIYITDFIVCRLSL